MSARFRLAYLPFLAACAAAGCLPAGDPPQGQLIMQGRDDVFVRFQPTGPDQPTRLIAVRDETKPTGPVITQSLSVYDLSATDPATGQVEERLLMDDVLFAESGCYGCGYAYDARGRLLMPRLGTDAVTGASSAHFARVDPKTGERADLGLAGDLSLSANRTLILVTGTESTESGTSVTGRVLDLDDHETLLPPAKVISMVGDDIYFVSPDDKLHRLRGTALAATPELAALDVASFQRIDTARGPLLLLSRPTTGDAYATTHAVFEPATFKELPLSGEDAATSYVQPLPSPDGRFVLFQVTAVSPPSRTADQPPPQTFSLLDRDTETWHVETFAGATNIYETYWRPGHAELWFRSDMAIFRWRVGEPVDSLPGVVFGAGAVYPSFSIFTPDGDFWVSYGTPSGLRPADDPTAEQQDLGSEGTQVGNYWPLPDGRGIAEVFRTYQFHADLLVVDPVARTSRTVGTGGYVVAVGAHRALALLAWIKSTSSGTLTLIDLDTGAKTVLGENVHSVALEAPPSQPDRLPPGTRVAFVVRNRIASPYDGVWVTTLP